jgi:hypothetical protein
MFTRVGHWWNLNGKNHRKKIKIIGKTGSLIKDAIFDTGSSNCVFSEDDFKILFAGESLSNATVVRGIGFAKEVSRRITVELYSEENKLIDVITNVSASFILDTERFDNKTGKKVKVPFDEALIGVSNVIDRFCWVLDYRSKIMTIK